MESCKKVFGGLWAQFCGYLKSPFNACYNVWLMKLITGGKGCYDNEVLEMVGTVSSLKVYNAQRKTIANNGTIILCWHLVSRNMWSGFLRWSPLNLKVGLQRGRNL